jgi:8-oxo-dGTP pyrophosphatase MutT (NUDIX family)/RimJ/RimL family protein N-acetyltransferase
VSGLQRTWDGLEVAADHPQGSTVVVRRHRDSEVEYLLLHRNVNGPEFEGDWAWTSPAGARQPGEAVYPAALRELLEEAGITGFAPWAIDLSGPWAVFGVDVPAQTTVALLDPEHDRYDWVSADEAITRIRPSDVAAATIEQMDPITEVSWEFRPMSLDDLPDLLRWRQQPHVVQWYGKPPADLAHAEKLYTRRIMGESPTRMWVAQLMDVPVGYLQDYRVAAYGDLAVKMRDQEAIGFDYLIGDADHVGRGVGTTMIWSFIRDVLCRDYPDAPRFTASPDHRNARSLRALGKCGFEQGVWIDIPKEQGQPASTEIVCALDRRRWFGHP